MVLFLAGATASLLLTSLALIYLLAGIIACHRKGDYPPSWLLYVFLTVCVCIVAMLWGQWPDLVEAAWTEVKGALR